MKYGVFVVIPVDRFDLTDDTIFSEDMAIVELQIMSLLRDNQGGTK